MDSDDDDSEANDKSTDLLVGKFREAIDNIEIVKKLQKTIESTQRSVRSIARKNTAIKEKKRRLSVVLNTAYNDRDALLLPANRASIRVPFSDDNNNDTNTTNEANENEYEEFDTFDEQLIKRITHIERKLDQQININKIITKRLDEENQNDRINEIIRKNNNLENDNTILKQLLLQLQTKITQIDEKVVIIIDESRINKQQSDLLTQTLTPEVINEITSTIKNVDKLKISITSQSSKIEKYFTVSNTRIESVQDELNRLIVDFRASTELQKHQSGYHHDVSPEIVMNEAIELLLSSWGVFIGPFEAGVSELRDSNRDRDADDEEFLVDAIQLSADANQLLNVLKHKDGVNLTDRFDEAYSLLPNLLLSARKVLKNDLNSAYFTTDTPTSIDRDADTTSDASESSAAHTVRQQLERLCRISDSIVDIRINKADLAAGIGDLDTRVTAAATKRDLTEHVDRLKTQLSTKADLSAIERITSTKASLKDLKKMRDSILRDSLTGLPPMITPTYNPTTDIDPDDPTELEEAVIYPTNPDPADDSPVAGGLERRHQTKLVLTDKSNEVINQLAARFEALHNEYTDLKLYNKRFVPREEVNEAMQSLVREIKAVKSHAVSTHVFNEALKTKADEGQLQKYVKYAYIYIHVFLRYVRYTKLPAYILYYMYIVYIS